jgi:hypothetical protein
MRLDVVYDRLYVAASIFNRFVHLSERFIPLFG